jgi:hypothetical protein
MSSKAQNAGWRGLEDVDSSLRPRIEEVYPMVNLQELKKAALSARTRQGEAATAPLDCTIDRSLFTHGTENIVWEVSFSDGVSWIAKIRYRPVGPSSREDMLSEIAAMKTVKERTSVPVPQVFAYDVSPTNSVGYPYMLVEMLPGRTMGNLLDQTVPREHQPEVARQLGNVLYQLYGLTFDHLGRLWRGEDGSGPVEIRSGGSSRAPRSSLEWLYVHCQRRDRELLKLHPHPDDAQRTACWVLRTVVPYIIIDSRACGPFPLCHTDLSYQHLLFDDNYKLTGVVGWGQAQTAPLECLVVIPGMAPKPSNYFVSAVLDDLRQREVAGCAEERSRLLLSRYFGSKKHQVAYHCIMAPANNVVRGGFAAAQELFGHFITWGQLVHVYGQLRLFEF